jgi:hypothetical protein
MTNMITLSFNNMYFLVLNLFGHDITHDAHPFGIGEGRLIKAFAQTNQGRGVLGTKRQNTDPDLQVTKRQNKDPGGGGGGGGGENNSMKGGAGSIIDELESSSMNTTYAAISDLIYDSRHKYCLYILSSGDGMRRKTTKVRRKMVAVNKDIAVNNYTTEVETTVIIDTGEIDRLLELIRGTAAAGTGTICNYMDDNKFGYFKNIYINGIVFEPINIVVQYVLHEPNGKSIRLILNKKPSIDSDFYAIYEIYFNVDRDIHECIIQTDSSTSTLSNSEYTLVSTRNVKAINDKVSDLYTCKLENIENWEKIQTLNVIEPNYEAKNLLRQLLKSCEGELKIDTGLTLSNAIQQLFIVSTPVEFYQKYQIIITAITQPPFTSILTIQTEVIDILINYIIDSEKVSKDVMKDWKLFLINILETEDFNMDDTAHFNYYYFVSGLLLKLNSSSVDENSSSLDEPIDATNIYANTHRSGVGQYGGQLAPALLFPPLTYSKGAGSRGKYTINYPYEKIIDSPSIYFLYTNLIFGINFDIDTVKNAISEFMKIYKCDVLFDDILGKNYFDTILTYNYNTSASTLLSEELDYNNSIISIIDAILSKNLPSSNIKNFISYIKSITTIHGRIKTIQKKFGLKYKKLIILFEEFENMLTYQIRHFCLYITDTQLTYTYNGGTVDKPVQTVVTLPVPTVDPPFLENFRKNVIVYIDILNFINGFNTPNGIKLTAEQKNVGAAVVCASVNSIITELNFMKKSLPAGVVSKKDSILLDGQNKILSKLLLEANIKKGSTGSGNIDEKLEAFFLQYIQAGPGGLGNFEGNANYKSGVIPSNSTLFKELGYPGRVDGKIFINNAVSSIGYALHDVSPFFCPISSVVDGQPTCSSETQANKTDGMEYGNMDVTLQDEAGYMSYRITTKRGDPTARGPSSVYKITAQLILNGKTIVDLTEYVDINKPRDSPLSAVKVLIKMIETNQKNYDTLQSKSWMSYLHHLGSSDSSTDSMRKNILEVSIIKSLGDFLQELNAVTENGGYIDIDKTYSTSANIADPNFARLGLHNDRPAAIRAMLLALAGKLGINRQAIVGFLGPYDKNTGTTRYFIVNANHKTNMNFSYATGGKNKRNKKRKTKKNKKRKTKKNKKRKTINKKRKTINKKRFSHKK